MPPPSGVESFCFRLEVDGDCVIYNGPRDPDGYGRFRGKAAHRWAYATYVGEIPEGLSVLHSCDNPPCVNPAHLRVGTQQDNVNDMWNRGRAWRQNVTKTLPKIKTNRTSEFD